MFQNLVEERRSWNSWFEDGYIPPYVSEMSVNMVETYRQNKDDVYWRASLLAERACAYIIYKEAC